MNKRTNGVTFLWGLLIGGLIYLIVWYWQKSTSAEDGALAMLDRLAAQERELARLRGQVIAVETGLGGETAVPPFLADAPTLSDADLTQIKGVGEVFAAKLREAGVATISQVAQQEAASLAAMLEIGEKRAAAIVAAAAKLAQGLA